MRALWIPSWDLAESASLAAIIDKAAQNDFNTLLVEVRFRCDAFYEPNRSNRDYINPDLPSYLLNEDYDALQFTIDQAKELGLEVYAWLTVFVATPRDLSKCNLNNPWFRTADLITTNVNFEKMPYNELEGAFLDPGVPEVQDYTYNVIMDIAMNYDIDGIQLDYIRYPGQIWGYNPLAYEIYQADYRNPSPRHWQEWRTTQINNMVKRIAKGLKNRKPRIELTAAVIANPQKALQEYNQDWLLWLRKGYVKRVFPMNYHADCQNFQAATDIIASHGYKNRTVMGIRAWEHAQGYEAEDINKKINYSWKKGIYSYALFSSTGINKNNYWKDLIIRKSR